MNYGGNNIPPQPAAAAPKRYDGKNGAPLYDSNHGGHYGASAAIAAAGHPPPPETFTGHWQNVRIVLSPASRLHTDGIVTRYRKDCKDHTAISLIHTGRTK